MLPRRRSNRQFYIPAKTITYARKYLTRRSLVLYSGAHRPPRNRRAPAGIDLSALQYGILNIE
jgi:hypothetical protein